MALGAGDICAIVFGIYSLIVSLLFVALLVLYIKKRRTKSATPAVSNPQRSGGSGNQALDSQEGNAISSGSRLRADLEAQRRYREEAEPLPPIGFVKVELRRDEVQRQASIINDTPVRRSADRRDSLDVISFGTVRSSDDSDSEERKMQKRKTVIDLSENIGQHEFSSVKSDSDSAETFYGDVLSATPKIGPRQPGRQWGRPSISSTLSHEFFDVQELGDDNVYLDLTGEGSSSGNDVTYDDVRVTSGQKEIPKLRKKAPPPKPPQLSKIPSENEIIDDVAENGKKTSQKSLSSSSSSDDESPELRKKEYLAKDREVARRSYQSAPEQYRKESSYLEVNDESTERPKVPKVEKIREEISEKLSSASSSSTMSSTSSKASVIRANADQERQKQKQEEQKQKQEEQKQKQEEKKVRLDSTSSSSSNESVKMSENDLPKYVPRKSSFSSPSELEADHLQPLNKVFGDNQDSNKMVLIFGEEPGESVDIDVEKNRKKIRTNLSESTDSDSDSSASEASFHIEHPEIVAKPAKLINEIVRSETLESTDVSEAEAQKDHQQSHSDSEPEIRFEIQVPTVKIVTESERRGSSDGESSNDSRRSSTSSSQTSKKNLVEKTKRPTLVRSSLTFDQEEVPVKKTVKIVEPNLIESSSEEISTEDSSEEEEDDVSTIPPVKIVDKQVEVVDRNANISYESSSALESSEEEEEVETENPNLRIPKYENINFQLNGRTGSVESNSGSSTASSLDNNVEEMVFENPKIVYATEVIVEDEVEVKQCKPVSVSSSSSESDSSDEEIISQTEQIVNPNLTSNPKTEMKVQHANTLPMTNVQTKHNRRDSSDSSNSSSGPLKVKRAQTLSDWSPSILKRLNRNYEPVYRLRKVNSMTQTDNLRPNSTET